MFVKDNKEYKPVLNPNLSKEQTKNFSIPVNERLEGFNEIEHTFTEEEALNEAKRYLKGCQILQLKHLTWN